MAITPRPQKTLPKPDKDTERKIEKFIEGAPDSGGKKQKAKPERTADSRFMQFNREQISVTLPPGVADKLSAVGAEMGMTRSAVINAAISAYLAARDKND